MRVKKSSGMILPLVCAVLSLFCGVLRARELRDGFDPAGLLIAGASSAMLLHICAAVAVLLMLMLLRLTSGEKRDYAARYVKGPGAPLLMAGMVLLLLSGPADWLLTRRIDGTVPTSRLILMAFGSLAGILGLFSLLRYKNSDSERLRGVFALGPVFFGCYLMIIMYKDIAAVPSMEMYAYLVLGCACMLLAWYFAAAHAFGIGRPRVACGFAAAAALTLSIALVGDLAAWALYGIQPQDWGMLAYLAAGLVWSFGGICAYIR